MIRLDDKVYYPYALLTGGDSVLGLDSRPIAEVEAEWLVKAKRAAERAASRDRAAIKAELLNELLIERRLAKDDGGGLPEISLDGVGPSDDLRLDDVEAPPAEVTAEDEVVRLGGLPDGHGCASILAAEVTGVQRAFGEVAEELCRRPRTVQAKKRRRER